MAFERTCIVDRVKYKYCHNCSDFDPTEKWRYLYCCDNCRQIYLACDDFVNNNISALEAQDKLNALDLSKKDEFIGTIRKNIDDIYSVERPKKKVKKMVIDEPTETEIVNEDLI